MLKINTMDGHKRMSTQELLLTISQAVKRGETEFDIAASGQHDIGGPLWHPDGKKLFFHVTNAGQRLGSMCLPNTEILVDESTSADVGWLNSGGVITVRGDAGDTAGHCSSGGKIFIGGRAGTRTGSLMKHDPLYEEPELWVLKNVGSFSFEFMGGGRAVVCGYDCEEFSSVLGERACVGMVGGLVYVRGAISTYPADIRCLTLDSEDIGFLQNGLGEFLAKIGQPELKPELSDWSTWHKLRPLTFEEKHPKPAPNIREFRLKEWVSGGIFSDVAKDDFAVHNTISTGLYRLKIPHWENANFAAPCEFNCPTGIPTQKRYALIRAGKEEEAFRLELEYTPFPGSVCGSVCPNPCMEGCSRQKIDEPMQIGALGYKSAFVTVEPPATKTGKKIGIIGGGVCGLSAAWQLARKGHTVTVYDEALHIGGKLEQVIPRGRLSHDLLEYELKRIENLGVKFVSSCKVDKNKFQDIRQDNNAVILAVGGSKSRLLPWVGIEYLTLGLGYLKAINCGEKPATGKKVIVIGAGNSGMDVCRGAYEMGAESVIAVDVQQPAAFQEEIDYIESLGGKIIWPFFTKKITPEGIYDQKGNFLPADQVIVAIGEEPVLDFLPDDGIEKFRNSWLVTKADKSIMPGVFAAGDVCKPGRLTDAIGDGRRVAWYVDLFVMGKDFIPFADKEKIPAKRLSLAYFDQCHPSAIGDAATDCNRCISCGTCRDCQICLKSCPEKAITRLEKTDGTWEYQSDPNRCIGCGICAGVCPCGVWSIADNPEPINIYSTGA